MHQTTMAVAAMLAALTMAGCGDSGGATSVGPFQARSAPGVSLSATLSITGSATLSATWVDEISNAASAPSCALAVAGFVQDGPRYDVPRSPLTTAFGGHAIGIAATLSGYHGAAAYPASQVASADGTPTLVTIDGLRYGATAGSTVSAVVKPDDSGTLTFSKLGLVGVTGTSSISGSLSWTCATLRPGPPPSSVMPAAGASSSASGPAPTPASSH